MPEFAKKEYVKLNKVFGKETEFSKWLANEGIEHLKQALGVELVCEGTEVKPNKEFSVDILMSVDSQYANGKPAKVVIENQYGRTDHEHFSKLITYAVANEAKYAVWIAEEIHPEHEAAINWLNDNTSENINFYVFKAVIEKIGNSPESFSLISVCEPKEELKISMSEKRDTSELNLIQLRFWQTFKSAIETGNYPFRSTKGKPQHWYNIYIGNSQCNISINMLSQEKKCRIELWIYDNKEFYDSLFAQKTSIENTVGRELIWDRKDTVRNGKPTKASSIGYEMCGEFDILCTEKHDQYISDILRELKEHFFKISKFV